MVNPMEEYHRQRRKKEEQKNKQRRDEQRTAKLADLPATQLAREIRKLDVQMAGETNDQTKRTLANKKKKLEALKEEAVKKEAEAAAERKAAAGEDGQEDAAASTSATSAPRALFNVGYTGSASTVRSNFKLPEQLSRGHKRARITDSIEKPPRPPGVPPKQRFIPPRPTSAPPADAEFVPPKPRKLLLRPSLVAVPAALVSAAPEDGDER